MHAAFCGKMKGREVGMCVKCKCVRGNLAGVAADMVLTGQSKGSKIETG